MKFVGQGTQKLRDKTGHRDTFAPVTLTLTLTLIRRPWHMILGLDNLKMYLHTKNEVSRM